MRVEHQVRDARNRGIDHVADGEGAGPTRPRLFHRRQGICGLATLGNAHHQVSRANHRLPVAELAGQIHLAGDAGDVLDEKLAHQPCMI